MHTPTVVIGVLAALFGITTLILRQTKPGVFKKLDAMKARFGEKPGYVIHLVSYSLIPILFGIGMIVSGLNGGSLFDH